MKEEKEKKNSKDSKGSKNSEIKVNYFTAKVSPVVWFILDFVFTAGFILLFDLIWYNLITHEEFKFSFFGNIGLPLILAVVGVVTLVNNEKKKK